MNGGTGRDMLAEAFRNLPNLEIVDIRDFNSTRAPAMAPPLDKLRGPDSLESRTGRGLVKYKPSKLTFVSNIYTIVLAALAHAGARPSSLEVVLRNPNCALY